MRTFSYTCSLPVTWQRWRLHHSIRHIRKPHAARKHHGSMFDTTGVIAYRSFTLRELEFSTFLAPVTLTLTRWPSYKNSICRRWRYAAFANMNFPKLSSDRHIHTYIHTYMRDRQDQNYIPRRFAGGQWLAYHDYQDICEMARTAQVETVFCLQSMLCCRTSNFSTSVSRWDGSDAKTVCNKLLRHFRHGSGSGRHSNRC